MGRTENSMNRQLESAALGDMQSERRLPLSAFQVQYHLCLACRSREREKERDLNLWSSTSIDMCEVQWHSAQY